MPDTWRHPHTHQDMRIESVAVRDLQPGDQVLDDTHLARCTYLGTVERRTPSGCLVSWKKWQYQSYPGALYDSSPTPVWRVAHDKLED